MVPIQSSGVPSIVNARSHPLGLWHEYCGVLTNFSIQNDSATLEYDDVAIYITITDSTRVQIMSLLVPSNIGQHIHVLHTDIPEKPFLLRKPKM